MPTVIPENTTMFINGQPLKKDGEGVVRLYAFPSSIDAAKIKAVFEDPSSGVADDDKDQLAFIANSRIYVIESDELTTGQWFGNFAKTGDNIQIGQLSGEVLMVNDQWSKKSKSAAKWGGVALGAAAILGSATLGGKAAGRIFANSGDAASALVAGGAVMGGAAVAGTAVAGSSLMKETQKEGQNDIPLALSANPFLCALEVLSEQPQQSAAHSVSSPPPAPSAVTYHYHCMGEQLQLSVNQIAQRISSNPQAAHLVWKEGFANWVPARSVAEINARISTNSPPPIPGI